MAGGPSSAPHGPGEEEGGGRAHARACVWVGGWACVRAWIGGSVDVRGWVGGWVCVGVRVGGWVCVGGWVGGWVGAVAESMFDVDRRGLPWPAAAPPPPSLR